MKGLIGTIFLVFLGIIIGIWKGEVIIAWIIERIIDLFN